MTAKIVVIGNEKGGTGKSTMAMHIIISLMYRGFKVASIDIDARQGSLTRYINNRKLLKNDSMLISEHFEIFPSQRDNKEESRLEDADNLSNLLKKLDHNDYIVIDTPGSDISLSQLAHAKAETLITPINDSFVDLDMLVRLNQDASILKPSVYAENVWEYKKQRALNEKEGIDWIVVRNRISNIYSKNKSEIEKVLNALAKRIGFRVVVGFSDRVIFKELFLQGLTLLDLDYLNAPIQLSHVAARSELNDLSSLIFKAA